MEAEEIRKKFDELRPRFQSLKAEAQLILEEGLEKEKIKVHSISSRVKELASFLDKVKRKESAKPFEDIRDIVGLRVVCLFLSDIPRVAKIIRDSLTVLSEDDKIEGGAASSFGYMSYHFIADIPKGRYIGPRYNSIVGMPFEIQVRTILMDAWANVSHYLSYKADVDVPSQLKRDFYALSGLFYIADNHFELFFKSRRETEQKLEALARESQPRFAEQEINLDSLGAYLRNQFPEREAASTDALSQLVGELAKAGYKTIGDVDALLKKTVKAVEAVEREKPADLVLPLLDSGVVRFSLFMIDENFNAEAMAPFPSLREAFAKYRALVQKGQ